MTLLFMVAVIFLPSIGLWSLYKDKHLVKSTEPGEQQQQLFALWKRKVSFSFAVAKVRWGGLQAVTKEVAQFRSLEMSLLLNAYLHV
ncbi:hypothetical protein DBR06_SOUSAS7310046, partial [Sousa chinensis]